MTRGRTRVIAHADGPSMRKVKRECGAGLAPSRGCPRNCERRAARRDATGSPGGNPGRQAEGRCLIREPGDLPPGNNREAGRGAPAAAVSSDIDPSAARRQGTVGAPWLHAVAVARGVAWVSDLVPRLHVCTTCRAGRPLAEGETAPGQHLHDALAGLVTADRPSHCIPSPASRAASAAARRRSRRRASGATCWAASRPGTPPTC